MKLVCITTSIRIIHSFKSWDNNIIVCESKVYKIRRIRVVVHVRRHVSPGERSSDFGLGRWVIHARNVVISAEAQESVPGGEYYRIRMHRPFLRLVLQKGGCPLRVQSERKIRCTRSKSTRQPFYSNVGTRLGAGIWIIQLPVLDIFQNSSQLR
jgi:hypothetical protein